MNFPTATANDWNAARRRLERFCRVHDLDATQAEEVAQACLAELLTHTYRDRCPASLAVAVGWRLATARRYGVGTLTRAGRTTRRRRQRTGQQEAQPAAEPMGVRDVSGRPGPDAIAAAIESAAGPVIPSPVATRRRAQIEAWVRDAVTGWGEGDEPGKTVPSVTDLGPGYTPPARGCRGLHRDTDPRPAAAVQAQPLAGEALAIYRERLAEHYAH